MIKAGIIGGTGYTGGELIRLLLNHPNAELSFVTSYSNVGKKVTDLHQDLIGEIDLEFIDNSTDADVLFLALPHKESKIWLENNNVGNAVVIDLGNDFRVGETYQGNSFVYGLPELNLEQIKGAKIFDTSESESYPDGTPKWFIDELADYADRLTEKDMITESGLKEKDVALRETELKQLQAKLKESETSIRDREDKLKAYELQVNTLAQEYQATQKNIDKFAQVYSTMKPEAVAKIALRSDLGTIARIFEKMDNKKIGLILDAMAIEDPKKVTDLIDLMTKKGKV